jgi:peptidyl-dipeptidase Dcp
MSNTNPLLSQSDVKNQAPDFASIKEEHFMPAIKSAIEEAKNNIEKIKNNSETPTFENVIETLEIASERLGVVTSVFYNQLSAAGSDALHSLAEEIGPITAAFSSDVMLDETLFKKIKTVYDKKETLSLNKEQETLLEETYQGFVRGGALLETEDKESLKQINQDLSILGPTFMNNVTKSSESFELIIKDEKDLAGLPESAIESAAHAAKQKNYQDSWLFTLEYPSFGPFMQYADNRELREKIWRAFSNRAYEDEYDNCETILKTINLKNQRAKLLGYKDHASYVLERRMAKSPEEVHSFLNKLKYAYKPEALKDLKKLQDFAQSSGFSEDLMPWDIGYFSEKLKEELFKFSSEDLRPYFQLSNVLSGCFEHFSKLFDLKFEENTDYPVWHDDVKAYDVFEISSNRFIGTLYGDFHPRIGKKDGAWKTSYRDQGIFLGNIERPVVAIVCNFTKPTNEKPSLLTHGEVQTLFHEMGHAIHALLSDITYSSLAGTNVKWDFVELPSQLQENWTFQKETLDLFAQHYETGEKIPEELIKKLNDAKNFMVAWAGLRQINFGLLDMAWHSTDPNDISNVAEFEDEITADTSLFPRYGGPFSTAFSHLFAGGYSAGYYSYKWAEVLDADAFELFQDNGLYNQDAAQKYKEEVLSKGGSEHPSILYENFRGRGPDPNALLRREGLMGAESKAA